MEAQGVTRFPLRRFEVGSEPELNDKVELGEDILDKYERAFFELKYENAYLKQRGDSFQDFFSSIMELRHPGDFVRVRPWGSKGDQKNDGYLRSARTLFQVYAPNEMSENDAIKKIDEDFSGAFRHWQANVSMWLFVHNSFIGLGPGVLAKIIEIDKFSPEIRCGHWGFHELRLVVFELTAEDLASLFGSPPTARAAHELRTDDIGLVIYALSQMSPPVGADLRPVSPDKHKRNDLSIPAQELLGLGMKRSDMVARFFAQWIDPELGDRIAAAFHASYVDLKHHGLSPDRIFSELWDLVVGGERRDAAIETATLAVLAHLFESCDIFER